MVNFTVYSMVGIVRNNTMIDDTHNYFGNVAFKCKLEQTYSSRVEMQRVNLWNISKLNRPMNILFNIEIKKSIEGQGHYHIKSRVKRARGIISPFPIIASNIEKADKPLMLSGFRKFVHWTGSTNCCQCMYRWTTSWLEA